MPSAATTGCWWVSSMKRNSGKTTDARDDRWEQVIAALLTATSLDHVAKVSRISRATIWRWLRDEGFAAAYRTARQQVIEHPIGGLHGAAGDAVDALRRNLTCNSPSVEVQAARSILDQAFRARELMDLEERLATLERRVGVTTGAQRA